ncbi:MAG: Zn-ribbon domain-containing OB-fold protein, partial [Candidatus Geothermarchaeales archaeon]
MKPTQSKGRDQPNKRPVHATSPKALSSAHSLTLSYDIPIEGIKEFWDGIEKGKILTTRCKHCGSVFFPPQTDCPECLASDTEWIELSREAELEAYTKISYPPESFRKRAPYVVGIGRLKEGVRVLAWIIGADIP